ncbi:MAG: hypothetical protein HYY67_04610 [Thaumarchaeota archaeon]|nr:hypothetical protein [Nitrososphaerota archaeon]
MALGEMLGEERGKITGTRVLPSDGQGPKIETSFQASGKILGVEHSDIGTYLSVMRPSGVIYGEGQGVIMTKDGETVSWTGSGVGKPTGRGAAARFSYSITYQTMSQRLARLNSVVGVGEYEADENGNTYSKTWEWK